MSEYARKTVLWQHADRIEILTDAVPGCDTLCSILWQLDPDRNCRDKELRSAVLNGPKQNTTTVNLFSAWCNLEINSKTD